jgi:phosphinothricin acetyltransferase
MRDAIIRPVEQGDLEALTEIYNHYVRDTAITLDTAERDAVASQAWLDSFAATGRYQCFAAACDGVAIGWASSHRYNPRAGYDATVMASIYLAPDSTGAGLGRRLYQALFEALSGQDIHRVFGGITLPNAPSVALHRAFGFEPAGIYPEVGRKFGRFWDVGTYLKLFQNAGKGAGGNPP